MFDFRFQQKTSSRKKQRPHAKLQQPAARKGCAPRPVLPVTPGPSSPRSLGTPPKRSAPARHPQKGAARALGHCKPSPDLHPQPLFCSGCAAPGMGGIRHPVGMAMSRLCRLSPLVFAQQSPRSRARAGGDGDRDRREVWSWQYRVRCPGTRRSLLARKVLPRRDSRLGKGSGKN